MSDIEYNENRVQIENQTISLPDKIGNAIEHEDTLVLILEPFGEAAPQNIVAYDRSGTKLWDIETTPADDGKSSPYTGIKKVDNRVIAFVYNSRRYEVDTQTGEIEDIGFYK